MDFGLKRDAIVFNDVAQDVVLAVPSPMDMEPERSSMVEIMG